MGDPEVHTPHNNDPVNKPSGFGGGKLKRGYSTITLLAEARMPTEPNGATRLGRTPGAHH